MIIFHVVVIICTLALVLMMGHLLGGLVLGLALGMAVLAVAVGYHVCHLYKFTTWLQRAEKQPTPMPSAVGLWQAIFDDIAQKDQHRQKKKERQEQTISRLNRMIATVPSAVMLINKKGQIVWKNALADSYFGLGEDKRPLIKQVITDPSFHEFLDTMTGVAHDIKLRLEPKTYVFTLVPIEANASMLIAHDISASEQLNISKNAFIANVSHELRTPLTVIGGFLETMQDMPKMDIELQREFVALMTKESNRMLDLVNDLLTLSRLENDEHHQDNFEPINLSELVADVVEDAQALSSQHHISTDIAPNIQVSGVYKELYSALSNLVFNAIRHTSDGTKVDIELTMNDNSPLFIVKDTGEGIEPEHLLHLTERFYRVDKGRSRKTGGSGLGLAIAKHALARHKAVLEIDSEVGVGSVFRVCFDKSPNQ